MKIRLTRHAKNKNYKYIALFLYAIFIAVVLDFVNTLLKVKMGFEDTQIITLIFYSILLLISMANVIKYRDITFKKAALYIIIILAFVFNYYFVAAVRPYLVSTDMLLVYIFYLPMSIFVVTSINNWDEFLNISKRFSSFAIILNIIGTIFLEYKSYLNYMEFSYAALPFIAIAYLEFRENKRFSKLVLFSAGFFNIIIFGARGPIMFLIIFILAYEIITFNKHKALGKVGLVYSIVLLIMAYVILNPIMYNVSYSLMQGSESYFLERMFSNSLFDLGDRRNIYDALKNAVNSMGLHVYGLFADRYVISGTIYSHNIIYEFLLSFGMLGGTIAIIALFGGTFVSFIRSRSRIEKLIVLLFFMTLFARYFISGSFVIEGRFYLYASLIFSIGRKRFDRNEGHKNCKHYSSHIQYGQFNKKTY